MGTISFAAEKDIEMPVLNKINAEGISITVKSEKSKPALRFWSGRGAAPQITNIHLYDYGTLENGNFAVVLKVYGYGSDATYFNEKKIAWI